MATQVFPRIRDLLREGAVFVLCAPFAWLDEFEQASLDNVLTKAVSEDPALAAAIRRTIRATLFDWATANVRDPGAPVQPTLGPDSLEVARALVRRGFSDLALAGYRVGQNLAWLRWMQLIFGLTSDPSELRLVLDISARSISWFIDATLSVIRAQVLVEQEELTRGTHSARLQVANLPATGRFMLRIAILSRNLTGDRSWDIGIVMDSRGAPGSGKANEIGALLRAMPSWCGRPPDRSQLGLIAEMARDVERARWRLPDGLGAVTFHALGTGPGRTWIQPKSDRLVVISPFLTSAALRQLAASSQQPVIVISRSDALDRCWAAARDGFGRQAVLAVPDDPMLAGKAGELHGKALVWEAGQQTRMAIGSMNATSAAMGGRNVEVMATFDCRKALGEAGIDALLDRHSLGAVIEDFEPAQPADEKPAPFDDRPARVALWDAKLHIACTASDDGWRIALVADGK